jgi:hypothetical protein
MADDTSANAYNEDLYYNPADDPDTLIHNVMFRMAGHAAQCHPEYRSPEKEEDGPFQQFKTIITHVYDNVAWRTLLEPFMGGVIALFGPCFAHTVGGRSGLRKEIVHGFRVVQNLLNADLDIIAKGGRSQTTKSALGMSQSFM